ncbi:cactin [Tachysurus ichikawai]
MGGDEAQFSVEMPRTGKIYMWADKYRPRKPRFFNRVHTGFGRNKYNQTHYGFENLPHKIVQVLQRHLQLWFHFKCYRYRR